MLHSHLAEVVLPQPGGPSNRMARGQLLAYFLRVLRAMLSNTCSQMRSSQDLGACKTCALSGFACGTPARAEVVPMQACCHRNTAAMPAGKMLVYSMQLQGQEAQLC